MRRDGVQGDEVGLVVARVGVDDHGPEVSTPAVCERHRVSRHRHAQREVAASGHREIRRFLDDDRLEPRNKAGGLTGDRAGRVRHGTSVIPFVIELHVRHGVRSSNCTRDIAAIETPLVGERRFAAGGGNGEGDVRAVGQVGRLGIRLDVDGASHRLQRDARNRSNRQCRVAALH